MKIMKETRCEFTFHLAKIKNVFWTGNSFFLNLISNLSICGFLFSLLLDIFNNGVLFVKNIPGRLI